jgi:NAD(P)-dependent dehydrogenase (short-subunit alcohol dehydrogenase family)
MTTDLNGRVAVVTGGSRGLGREMVRALAGAGADVVIASRKLDACQALAREVEAQTGRRALPLACHVGSWADCDALADAAYAEFGRVDVLINNAGIAPQYDRVEDVSENLWDKVLDVNLKGAFRLSARVGARMAADGGGSIINVSSLASLRPRPAVIPYAAAKAGVNAMTEAFAHAFGPSVRVNAILPGTFFTDISRHWDMKAFAEDAATMALRRGGEPHEITGIVLYLAGDASSYTTGALIRVDGGFP